MDPCPVCTEDLQSAPTLTLECGHTFHAACITQWFRYYHTTCPVCRGEGERERWTEPTPRQRINMMRRMERRLPNEVRARLTRLREWRGKRARANRDLSELRRAHREVFRQNGNLRARARIAKQKVLTLEREINRIHVPGVPFLAEYETSEEEDSDDG